MKQPISPLNRRETDPPVSTRAYSRPGLSWSELRGILLVFLGSLALIYYYSWWFEAGRFRSPLLLLGFISAAVYGAFQVLSTWAVYLATHRRPRRPGSAVSDLTVDVFVTTCGEEYGLVERALQGICRMRGDHRTWLLDDRDDPRLAELAARLGAGHLTREGQKDAKAGNINAALARTGGDIVVIFDVDHVPRPDFLEWTLPLFADPDVGFVQVMLTFENRQDGWIAQAASDTTLDFFNPTSIGSDGLGSATLIGSNGLIRRSALASIERYQPGLAEDLATSLAVHAAGWHSVYVPEPLAPGVAPPDLASWFTQQLKWARGVFELLLTAYPRLFRRLTRGQRISYGVRMTFYWVGVVVAVHIMLSVIVLWSGNLSLLTSFADYVQHLLPVVLMTTIIRQLALRRWKHSTIHWSRLLLQFRAYLLITVTWPAYLLAWFMAIFRVPLSFRPTPKFSGNILHPIWVLPHSAAAVSLALGLRRFADLVEDPLPFWPLLIFLPVLCLTQLLLPVWWLVEFVRCQMGSMRVPTRKTQVHP